MYATTRVLVDLWEAFVSTHDWFIDFLPKPWIAIEDALKEGSFNWLWFTLLISATIYGFGALAEEAPKHGKPLLKKLVRVTTYAVAGPPVFIGGIAFTMQFMAGTFLYMAWLVVALYVGIFALFAYPIEWTIRLF